MLSRLRMTVDDCLQEYEALGGKIFGHPRPFSIKGVLWHKFNHRRLKKAVKQVTSRHFGQSGEHAIHFAMDRTDEDMTQW